MKRARKERPRSVCITGGARGLGRSLAIRFIQMNYDVTLIDKEAPDPEIKDKCRFVPHDFSFPEAGPEVRCDILILNHATFDGVASFKEQDADAVRRYININLLSHVLLLKRAEFKKVVFVNTVLSIAPFPCFSLYCSAKAFMRALIGALRREGVETLSVFPYKFNTPLFADVRDFMCMDVDYVADAIVDALERRCQTVYIPWIFRLSFIIELLPLCIQDLLVWSVFRLFVGSRPKKRLARAM